MEKNLEKSKMWNLLNDSSKYFLNYIKIDNIRVNRIFFIIKSLKNIHWHFCLCLNFQHYKIVLLLVIYY